MWSHGNEMSLTFPLQTRPPEEECLICSPSSGFPCRISSSVIWCMT